MGKVVVFDYMHKNDVAAHVEWDCENNTVTCTEFESDIDYQFFGRAKHDVDTLLAVMEHRCFDRNRYDAEEILEFFGLKEYNPYHILLKTHGVSTQDYMWIRWAGETLTWDDVRIRD